MSGGMLAMARQQTAEALGNAPIELVRGNALAMPFTAAFDVVGASGPSGISCPKSSRN